MLRRFIERLKLPFRKDRELRSALYRILGFYPHNIEYYKIAFAHKSQAFRDKKGQLLNNERLEFLGDAVLESVVSDILFHHFEKKHEGFLTSTRSKIVQRESLNKLAKELGIDKLVQTSTRSNSHHSHIGGNAFEALMGAVYLDKGYKTCQRFIRKQILGRIMDLDGVANKEVNFKSKLLEWCQKNRIQNDFATTTEESGKQSEPVFHCTVVIEGIEFGYGKGYSKKEAQQAAAKETLTILRRDEKAVDNVFRSKEKRTAMEENEVAILPKIDEIEQALQQEKELTKKAQSKTAAPEVAKKKERTHQEEPAPKQPENARSEKKEATEKTPAEAPAKEPRKEHPVKTAKEEQPEPARKEEQPAKPAKQKEAVETPAEQPAERIKATSVVIAEAAIAEAENKAFPVVEVPQRNKLPIVAETAVKTVQPQQSAVGNAAEPDNGVTPEADNDVTPSQQKPRRKKHQVHKLEEFTQAKPKVETPKEVAVTTAPEEQKSEKLSRRARRSAKLAKAQLLTDDEMNGESKGDADSKAGNVDGKHVGADHKSDTVAHKHDKAEQIAQKPTSTEEGQLQPKPAVAADKASSEAASASVAAPQSKMSKAERMRNRRKHGGNKVDAAPQAENIVPKSNEAIPEAEDNTLAPVKPRKTDIPAAAPRKKHQRGNSRVRRRMQALAAEQGEESSDAQGE